ncbi:hypothetical protein FOCG_17179 [Fusarium oxysporum f. sp. radicis-lycopersici 26381]|nr:hypothetical protein FOCG_17179 [Fusarium oxysporum f. sp. radicis-lycopersici 26381]
MSFYTEIGGHPKQPCIRLLKLFQAKNINDPIKCRLDVFELGEHLPPYEALSYCWGGNDQRREISCNGECFKTTENLFLAMAHLRNDNADRLLWIDAICINQANLEERKSQVLLMGKIYSEATKVVVWLGSNPGSDGVNHVFELVEKYPKFQRVKASRRVKIFMDMNFPRSNAWDFATDGSKEIGSPCEHEVAQPPVLSLQVMKGITSVMRRVWWTRVWTIQELNLSREAVFMCGNLSAPWSAFNAALRMAFMAYFRQENHNLVNEDSDFRLEAATAIACSRLLTGRPREEDFGGPRELGDLLISYRWLAATDKRDKIYGLLPLAESTYGIEPNYEVSTTICYIRAAFAILRGSRTLDLFRALRRPTCLGNAMTGLPSWVPDWSDDFSNIPEKDNKTFPTFRPMACEIMVEFLSLAAGPDISYPRFQASGRTTSSPRLRNQGRTLVLKGFILDKLSVVGGNMRYPHPGPGEPIEGFCKEKLRLMRNDLEIVIGLGELWSTLKGWKELAFGCEDFQKGSEETREDAFLTTICKDQISINIDRKGFLSQTRTCMKFLLDDSKTDATLKKLGLQNISPRWYYWAIGKAYDHRMDMDNHMSWLTALFHLRWAVDQRMARTKSGYLAIIPESSKVEDHIALLKGGKTPYVLRKVGEQWKILGDCYVHGVMFGESWNEASCHEIELI